MAIATYFDNNIIRQQIISHLSSAQTTVKAAVAWFTDEAIFKTFLSTANRGVKIELILINDSINKNSKIDFSLLQEAGVSVFWHKEADAGIMHHKFCIIDNYTVLSGSYNWTYSAFRMNRENLNVITDSTTARDFTKEFLFLREEIELSFSIQVNNYNNQQKHNNKLIPYAKYEYVFDSLIRKWGYSDKNFNVIVSFKYDEAKPFVEGLAAVRKDNLWGFIDQHGEELIRCQYGDARDFSDGIAVCLLGHYTEEERVDEYGEGYVTEIVVIGKWGCINNKGKAVIPFEYDSIQNFKNGFTVAHSADKYVLLNNNGDTIIHLKNGSIYITENKRIFCSYYIDIPENQYIKEQIEAEESRQGESIDHEQESSYYAYYRIAGYKSLEDRFLKVKIFDIRDAENNILVSHTTILNRLKGKFTRRNEEGEWYGLELASLSDNIFLVRLIAYFGSGTNVIDDYGNEGQNNFTENWTFMSGNGDILLEKMSMNIYNISENIYDLSMSMNKSVFRHNIRRVITRYYKNYEQYYDDNSDSYIKDRKYVNYEDDRSIRNTHRGIAFHRYVINCEVKLLDDKNEFITPIIFKANRFYLSEFLGDFNDELARIRIDTKYGYINKAGTVVIAPDYVIAYDFSEGLAVVKKSFDDDFIFIDINGQPAFENTYDKVIAPFNNGLALVGRDWQFYIDKNGNEFYTITS